MDRFHPQLIHADTLTRNTEQAKFPDEDFYVYARPLGNPTFYQRVKLAWGVFSGKYDALKWYRQ